MDIWGAWPPLFLLHCNKSHVELLLPFNNLVIHYMEKNKIPIRCVDMFQQKFINFPPNRIDDICEWIEEARETFHNIAD